MRIKRALISVSNKERIVKFAKELQNLGVEIISTGGTFSFLDKNGIKAEKVEDITGFPEILDGRVKTLHPKIHAALLNISKNKKHRKQMEKHGIKHIDLLVCNLYPFEKTIKGKHKLREAIENIDIGGPAMLRAASKNYQDVVVVTSPEQYPGIVSELKEKGDISVDKRRHLAANTFKIISSYDFLIYQYLTEEKFPALLNLRYEQNGSLRYGENPHQEAFLYRDLTSQESAIVNAKQLHGIQLSFNNIVDLDSALQIVREFKEPTAVIVKHTNPSGIASANTLIEAYKKALECDTISAFGGLVGLNRKVDIELAEELSKLFLEGILAPGYSKEALKILTGKKNLRLLEVKMNDKGLGLDIKKISGGLLVQTPDQQALKTKDLKVVTQKKPTAKEMKSLLFAWNVVKYVKSNAIVLARDKATVGIGAAQMSRVDSIRLAIERAGDKARGSILASDGFLPFRDNIDEAAKGGIKAIIQPGGSIRDKECIEAANEYGISMVFTGIRCFKH